MAWGQSAFVFGDETGKGVGGDLLSGEEIFLDADPVKAGALGFVGMRAARGGFAQLLQGDLDGFTQGLRMILRVRPSSRRSLDWRVVVPCFLYREYQVYLPRLCIRLFLTEETIHSSSPQATP